MSAFGAIDIGRTGIGFAGRWVDTIAHNLANANTATAPGEEPFRARLLVAQALDDQIAPAGSGVATRAIVEQGGEPPRTFEPEHPLADADGYVTKPVVDLAGQLADLMLAQRTYQANSRSVQSGKKAYESALQIGQR